MGSYIYNVTTKHIVTVDGTCVHFTKYAYKMGRDDERDLNRCCGPNIRAWENSPTLNENDNLYVHCADSKTQLATASDLCLQYGGGNPHPSLSSVYGLSVPDLYRDVLYGVAVHRGKDCVYCDDYTGEIAGFLIPTSNMGNDKPTARTVWKFVAAKTRPVQLDELTTAVGENARIMEDIGRDN
jgi:hypothetical protein